MPLKEVCGTPAPDRSGRLCDKPHGHPGDHWTYGGNTLTWGCSPDTPAPREREDQQRISDEFNAGLRTRCSYCECAFLNDAPGSYGSYCPTCNLSLTLSRAESAEKREAELRSALATALEGQRIAEQERDELQTRVNIAYKGGSESYKAVQQLTAALTGERERRAQVEAELDQVRAALTFTPPPGPPDPPPTRGSRCPVCDSDLHWPTNRLAFCLSKRHLDFVFIPLRVVSPQLVPITDPTILALAHCIRRALLSPPEGGATK